MISYWQLIVGVALVTEVLLKMLSFILVRGFLTIVPGQQIIPSVHSKLKGGCECPISNFSLSRFIFDSSERTVLIMGPEPDDPDHPPIRCLTPSSFCYPIISNKLH